MEVISTIILIMLTMVGYSSGITLASRGKHALPVILDLLIILVLWTVALTTRPQVTPLLGGSRFLLLIVWLLIAMLIGFVKTKLTRSSVIDMLPESELPDHAQAAEVAHLNLFKKAWEGWKLFAAEMGHIQGGLFMGFFYFIIVTVFGIGAKIFTDPMAIKSTPTTSGWVARKPLDATLEEALEQGQTN
ncbi:MAG: hypothetical protein ACI9EW_003733 [Cellvibrionaceae bacterium]|jgi:hypothetical protein